MTPSSTPSIASVNFPDCFQCKVVLEDVSSLGSAGKHKPLNLDQEKTHSIRSRQSLDDTYLQKIIKKQPIAWPKMSESESWEVLDGAVYNRLLGATDITSKVDLLESTIYNQASFLFGFLQKSSQGKSGLNHRARHSIELVDQRNFLLLQLNSCTEPSEHLGLECLLSDVKQKLARFRKGERNRKKCWKSLLATRAFKKNPYQADKDVLNLKCSTFLKMTSESMNEHKAHAASDSLFDIPLSPLEDLPPNPFIKKKLRP